VRIAVLPNRVPFERVVTAGKVNNEESKDSNVRMISNQDEHVYVPVHSRRRRGRR
jgi:hypothetical protein